MKETPGTVVFMGAGASKAFGLPLTNEILGGIVGRLKPGSSGDPGLFPGPDTANLMAALRKAFKVLYPGLDLDSVEKATLPNITSVLSLLDHLIFYDQPAALRFKKQELIECRRLFERAMMEVLLDTDLSQISKLTDVPRDSSVVAELPEVAQRRMTVEQRGALDQFISWLSRKRQASGGRLDIITTNYDVAVETPLFEDIRVGMPPKTIGPGGSAVGSPTPAELRIEHLLKTVDFGFDWRNPFNERLVPRPESPLYGIYKLHGSLNWLRCELCGQVYVNPLEIIAYLSFNEVQSWANTCACGASPLRHLIVAPSMVRDVRDPHLLNVWRAATEALRTATEWYVIGYSLPSEDLAIRSMLLRAFSARGLEIGPGPVSSWPELPGPRVTVVQKGKDAKPAFDSMFPGCGYLAGGLEELLAT